MEFNINPCEGFFYEEDTHSYFMDGKLIPGVTTICGNLGKPWLAAWKVKMAVEYVRDHLRPETAYSKKAVDLILTTAKGEANKRRDTAADKGKEVHAWVEAYIKGEQAVPASKDKEVDAVIQKFLAWEKATAPKWLKSEMMVASRQHEYAGTLDFIAEIAGKIVLGDFKTSKPGYHWDWGLQTAGYQGAVEEQGGKVDERLVVNLPMVGGEVTAYPVKTPYDLDWKTFLSLRQAQKWVSYTDARKEMN